MKKTIICCGVCIILTIVITTIITICLDSNRIDEQAIPIIAEADRVLNPPYGAGHLVSIVWYKDVRLGPYKLISNSRQIDNIHYRLQYKGSKEGNPAAQKPVSHDTKNLLAFVYYSTKEDGYRMRYIPFEIKDGVFYWKYGQDKKVAQILLNSEIWDRDLFEPSRVINDRSLKEEKAKEKYNIEKRREIIKQVKNSVSNEDASNSRDILDICKQAQQNLLKMESFAVRQEVLDEVISELDTNDLKESTIHAFAQIPEWMNDQKNIIDQNYISTIEELGRKYDDAGLDRDEQRELFEINQKINAQILDELIHKQEGFEKILKIKVEKE